MSVIDADATRRLLAERRDHLEHLLLAAVAAESGEGGVREAERLRAALEEINLLEICLLAPQGELVLYG